MRKFTLSLQLLLGVFFSVSLSAQTTTVIDYQAWTGATGCNIFSSATNVPATVGSTSTTIAHQNLIGQPTYSGGSNNAVSITCNAVIDGNNNTTELKGTEYRITYTFKQGHSYNITVNAACINNSGSNATLRLTPNSGGAATSGQCNGTATISSTTSGGLIRGTSITGGTTWTNYSSAFVWGAFSTAQSYLNVAAVPPIGSGFQTILIRKITIVESAPPPVFTITPSSTTIPCGSSTAKTFTVNNVNNSPGTLSYNWNLGSTNNGWIYNGSAAPQTFTTSANSITLTSSSAATSHSNVVVTVVLNGSNNSTLTSTVTTTPNQVTGLSITGNDVICSYGTSTYTLNGIPAGAGVIWSASPAGAVQFSCTTCPQTDVTPTGNQSVTITATVTGNCLNGSASKPLPNGTIREYADVQSANPYNPCFQLNQPYTFYISNPQEGVHYKWGLESPGAGLVMDPAQTDNTYGYFSFSAHGNNRVVAIPYSICSGDGEYDDYIVYISPYGCSGYRVQSNTELFPNPARDQVTIKLKGLNAGQTTGQLKDIREVRIVDKLGSVKRTQKYPPNTNVVSLNISNLPADVYYVEITDGKSSTRLPLSVIK